MELDKSAAIIEAILFTMGNAVELNTLMNVLDESPKELREQLRYLREKYAKPDSGISLIELEDSVQLCTKKEWYEYLIQVAKTPKKAVLPDALLETLSIIAYKQPITRLEIERIRGVNSDHAVSRLVEYGFVTDIGRMDAPGRPLLFGTTEEFLRAFGVRSLEELPSLDAVQVEEFKKEAENEINVKLDI
ncbi:MAG: SMC-Scp complex subunit ScpB [Lachnospiraceae bacterium]|nr:SMC-Scp complex subunit ScpB [Lachnospiraceae bacterium]